MRDFIKSITLFECLCVWASTLLTYVIVVYPTNWQTQTLLIVNMGAWIWGRVRGQVQDHDHDHN
jgi:hypothetical protein